MEELLDHVAITSKEPATNVNGLKASEMLVEAGLDMDGTRQTVVAQVRTKLERTERIKARTRASMTTMHELDACYVIR